jgi:hypothetical protein
MLTNLSDRYNRRMYATHDLPLDSFVAAPFCVEQQPEH